MLRIAGAVLTNLTRSVPCFLAAALLAACAAPISPLSGPAATVTETAFTPDPAPSTALSPTSSATLAPPPAGFGNSTLRSGVEAVSYLADQCAYYQQRWDPAGALPGTVVVPIMFHSILQNGETPAINQDINSYTFADIIQTAENLGYQTITTEQLLDFLEHNAKIPQRSMIMILDDRRAGTAEEHFFSVLEKNHWTLTLAWIARADTAQRMSTTRSGETLWEQVERVYANGNIDIQAHGLDHIYLTPNTSEEATRQEIAGAIPVLEEHFGITPLAYIWPGGNYTSLGLSAAHEAGYELGFTVHARGPLQFNWIPQGAEELAYNDPLMLLPRYWSSAASLNLQQAAQIGDEAQQFAKDNYAAEAEWVAQNCGSELPPLSEIFK